MIEPLLFSKCLDSNSVLGVAIIRSLGLYLLMLHQSWTLVKYSKKFLIDSAIAEENLTVTFSKIPEILTFGAS